MYLKIIGDHMRAIVYLISDGEKLLNEKLAGVSWELCGGTHVSGTSEIRGFKIISEQGVASGIWRIEAVAGEAFIEHVNTRDFYKEQSCSTLKVKPEEVTTRVENLFEELRLARNENSVLRAQAAVYKALVIANKPILVGNTKQYRVLVEYLDDVDADSLKSTAECLMERVADQAAVVLGSCASEGKVSLVAAFAPGVVDQGIQAGGRKPENLASSLEKSHNLSL